MWFDDADADHHDEHGGRINPADVQEAPEGPGATRTVGKPMRQTLSAGQPVTASVAAS